MNAIQEKLDNCKIEPHPNCYVFQDKSQVYIMRITDLGKEDYLNETQENTALNQTVPDATS